MINFHNYLLIFLFTEACECKAVYPGDRLCLPILIEDPKTTFITLSTLREIIYTLEQEHRTVLRTIARETKYGSKYVKLYSSF